eukprot:gnl/TRDRNA2_/TRDRNA2_91156_c1_seq1.p1 gnl/TRDRNA2_/TRDRNA2_91156_c1~~gnl/TRDRNA2_/TRDRNA2_91156_c1_seq1.p1  ORF type:complete len:211 (+),score=54.72 gnl/TRDRNA2_/TRDRNA2_91156_c1_seq1:65-697(+)
MMPAMQLVPRMAALFIALVLSGAAAVKVQRFDLANGARISSGFSLALESKVTLKAGTGTVLSASKEADLERSANAQVLRNRLSSARSHLQDVLLKIEDYTNSIEMGIKPQPKGGPEDAAELEKRMDKHMKKASAALVSLNDDLQSLDAQLDSDVSKNLHQALADANSAVNSCNSVVDAVRRADNAEAVRQLTPLRDALDRIDSVMQGGSV